MVSTRPERVLERDSGGAIPYEAEHFEHGAGSLLPLLCGDVFAEKRGGIARLQ